MPPPSDDSALLDIAAACRFVVMAVEGLDAEQFARDPFRESAVLHHLTIAGEATKRLSAAFRETHSTVNWRAVAGMRDVIVHRYDSDEDWSIATTSVQNLLAYIEPLLPEPPQ